MASKHYILSVLIFFSSMTLFAEGKLAVIKDPDGFTNIRSGPGKEFEVVDTLFQNEFFFFRSADNPEWAKVYAWKGRQVEGFIHKSRIQEVEKLRKQKQKELIIGILDSQRISANNFQNAWKSKDSFAYRTTRKILEFYSDTKYDPILTILPKYFCSTRDTEVLELFFATMWADKGSANEMPSFSIGNCFIYQPDLLIRHLAEIDNLEKKTFLFDHIEWGLLNHFRVDENGESTDKEYIKLKTLLDKERKKASP